VNPLPDLEARGLVYQMTHPELGDLLGRERITLYAGFDPTAISLHVGNLVPLLSLARFQRAGHRPIVLMGGGTGMIGDPSGRSTERALLGTDEIDANIAAQEVQMRRYLDFDDPRTGAILVNNADWLAPFPLVDFLRDVGKHFGVGVMLGKESVRARLEAGISFTEFSYMLLQAYDFLHLHQQHGCRMQIGGQDQWGNITAGMDLIRRKTGAETYGMTFPLITSATGAKFSKSESGTVWLSPQMTSPYELYQYFVNTDDRDVIAFLSRLTFVPVEEIRAYEAALAAHPEEREAQRRLAREMAELVHGPAEARSAEAASLVLFGGAIADVSDESLEAIFSEVPRREYPRAALEEGIALLDGLVEVGAAPSRSEARRLVAGGAVYLNNVRVEDAARVLRPDDLASRHILVLRKGKRNYYLLRFPD
jgi:tyrosyl-tRNA synthetase